MEIGKTNVDSQAFAHIEAVKIPTDATLSPKVAETIAKEVAPKPAKEDEEKQLTKAVEKLNKAALIFDRSLKFKIHEATHTSMVSVIDSSTEKVIREIPSKELLDLVSRMQDYMGMIFDKKA